VDLAGPVRAESLDVNEVEDGVIVYDESTDRVHHLNNTAAVVLELCDGSLDADGIATKVAEAFGLPDPPREEVRTCLDRLVAEGLVQ
jgi:PqqD family protein of HPr-rel-A system